MAERLFAETFDALDEQTLVVAWTEAAVVIVPSRAGSLAAALTSGNSWPDGSKNSRRPTLFPKS